MKVACMILSAHITHRKTFLMEKKKCKYGRKLPQEAFKNNRTKTKIFNDICFSIKTTKNVFLNQHVLVVFQSFTNMKIFFPNTYISLT